MKTEECTNSRPRKIMKIASSVTILPTGNTDVLQCISCIEMMINIIYYFAKFWLKKLQGCSQELLTSILH